MDSKAGAGANAHPDAAARQFLALSAGVPWPGVYTQPPRTVPPALLGVAGPSSGPLMVAAGPVSGDGSHQQGKGQALQQQQSSAEKKKAKARGRCARALRGKGGPAERNASSTALTGPHPPSPRSGSLIRSQSSASAGPRRSISASWMRSSYTGGRGGVLKVQQPTGRKGTGAAGRPAALHLGVIRPANTGTHRLCAV